MRESAVSINSPAARKAGFPVKSALSVFLPALCAWAAMPGAWGIEYAEREVRVGRSLWKVSVPAGYRVEFLAEIPDARMIAASGRDLIVGTNSGLVYRVRPPYDKPEILARPGGSPHGVGVRNGELWIAKSDGVYRAFHNSARKGKLAREDFRKVAGLPAGGGHFTRTVGIGPDGRVYLGIGISGNCSDEYLGEGYGFNRRRGGVLRLNERTGKWETYASGLRNPVGFDWHPGTGVLYASNNGPDHLGYDRPPEYFSRLDEGSFHGMPWFRFDGNKTVRDSCAKSPPPRSDPKRPVAVFPARSAPMGVAFASGEKFAPVPAGSAAVALHGSWATKPRGGFLGKRSTRRPPMIVAVDFNKRGEATGRVRILVKGLQNASGDRLLRPVGVLFGADGNLYFTSDGGARQGLFRLTRTE